MITNLLNCGQYVTFSFVGKDFFTKYVLEESKRYAFI